MKTTISALVLLVSFSIYSQQKNKNEQKPFSVNGKTVTVYTTADSTKLRLALTDKLVFSAAKQPLESEICVFVDPK